MAWHGMLNQSACLSRQSSHKESDLCRRRQEEGIVGAVPVSRQLFQMENSFSSVIAFKHQKKSAARETRSFDKRKQRKRYKKKARARAREREREREREKEAETKAVPLSECLEGRCSWSEASFLHGHNKVQRKPVSKTWVFDFFFFFAFCLHSHQRCYLV